MKKLFLSSFFTDVSRLFAELMNDEHKEKSYFIPTAANQKSGSSWKQTEKIAVLILL